MKFRWVLLIVTAIALALGFLVEAEPLPAADKAKPGNPTNAYLAIVLQTQPLQAATCCSYFLAVPGSEAAKESPRLQKLKQLRFDRRPSAYLKVWTNPKDKPAEAPGKEEAKPDPIDAELAIFQRQVTVGDWPAVKTYLAALPRDEARTGYKQLIESLQSSPGPQVPGQVQVMPGGEAAPMMQAGQLVPLRYLEQNVFSPNDIMGLIAAAPAALDKQALRSLGGIVATAIDGGVIVEAMVSRFRAEADKAAKSILSRRQAAHILTHANQASESGTFLPTLEQAVKDQDQEALNLLARHYQACYAQDKKISWLEQAWSATQAALAVAKGSQEEAEECLRRAVELAPKLREEIGQAWLEQSFTKHVDRGQQILATLGAQASQGLQTQPMNTADRLKALQLQQTTVNALFKVAPNKAREWQETLTLLASAWLKEAEYSLQFSPTTTLGPKLENDAYGNFYFRNQDAEARMAMMQQNRALAIAPGDIVTTQPGQVWTEQIEPAMRPKLVIVICQLYLKVNEETRAFPYIEQLAPTHPEQARRLVKEFLRVWTTNHDPNEKKPQTNSWMYQFPGAMRASGIPITRAKQERNLEELAEWIQRLRRLQLGELDEELLAKAFTSSHSIAEVYRQEAIEQVFGPIGNLKPRTLAGLAQQMRENLAGVWRDPNVQQSNKTNRKPKDIEAEVLRGYSVAQDVVDNSLKKFPEDWALTLARAALMHDENNYRRELAKRSDFTKERDEAMKGFQKAARLYAAHLKDLREDEESSKVYEQWFHASLGSCDLAYLTVEKHPDPRQAPLIRAAMAALPGEAAERHRTRFVNTLVTQLNTVKAPAKFLYLRYGLDIAGDHKQAHDARKTFAYYKDLVNEIKLQAVLDGSDVVGNKQPFGVFINLRHTREIERESGGFGKYLQNQTGNPFNFNFGRPPADYRDRFQTAVKEALKDHFEVLSVTFQEPNVHSRSDAEYGWRVTPYAYLLLRSRGPQIDKLPPLRLDVDFADTTSYILLPIESPALPLDAKSEASEPRPAGKIQITQILDERQAGQGKLLLEIKASARGLVPDLDRLVKLETADFAIAKTEDLGVSVVRFDPDSDEIAVTSERNWLVTMTARPDLARPPQKFHYGEVLGEGTEVTLQRYQDADLVTANKEVVLEAHYGQARFPWYWLIAGLVVALAIVAGLVFLLRRRPVDRHGDGLGLPRHLTPFTVLTLLNQVSRQPGLSESQQAELERTKGALERSYFSGAKEDPVDLRAVAEYWTNGK